MTHMRIDTPIGELDARRRRRRPRRPALRGRTTRRLSLRRAPSPCSRPPPRSCASTSPASAPRSTSRSRSTARRSSRRHGARCADIPYGETVSYGEQARRIGKPEAVRAIGAANGRNPIAIVLPCHRVIGADGSLTGFGGGLETKRRLLDLEQSPSLF